MQRREFLAMVAASGAGFSLVNFEGAFAQDATPVVDEGLLTITWQLDRIQYTGGMTTTPDVPGNYTIQFLAEGQVAMGLDCNRGIGSFTQDGPNLTISEVATTLALCAPESKADEFLAQLQLVESFTRTAEASDQLVLNLSGTAGQIHMSPNLTGVEWQWTEFEGGDGSVVLAADPTRYSIEFISDGSIQAQIDCNRGIGSWTSDGSSIDIMVATTKMMCEADSQAGDFLRYLDEAVSWVIRDGMLALSLPADAGIAMFQAVIPE